MLPLQFSWSAVAVYCQHEKEQSTHFGHHSHEHEDKAGAKVDDSPDGLTKLTVDSDCAVCHISAQPSFLTGLPILAPPSVEAHEASLQPYYASHIPDGPNKPDWRLAA